MWTLPNGTAARVPRRGTGARLPLASTQPTHGCISPTSRMPSCLAVSCIKNSFTWPVEAWNKLMSMVGVDVPTENGEAPGAIIAKACEREGGAKVCCSLHPATKPLR
ncbi:unnamed protein product [Ectocarpus sp. CCAP 1310/34]|nr:unnamed protein product [Ectocarpus sp. CCAP 1310/34]